jgi:hypothetical protein
MEFLEEKKKESGSWKIMLGALVAAALVVAGIFWLISLKPSAVDVEAQAMEGAFREGSPEFAQYGKRVILGTDEDRLMKSPTAMGNVMMSVGGKVKNLTGKTITALEINLAVIDMAGKPIKDKTVLLIPSLKIANLEDRGEEPVTVTVEGLSKESDPANFRWKVTAIKVQ